MIIYSKLLNKYSKDEIYQIFPTISARKIIFSRDCISPGTVAQYCSFEELNYSLQDFLEDYPKYLEYKSVDILFEIYKKGYSILSFRKKMGISSYLEYMIKHGVDYNTPITNGYKIIEFMKYDINLKKFKIDKYDSHIELFGEKEDLSSFKEKYNINFEVIYEPYKKCWHLAFNGMLADYIRIHN